MAPRHKPRKYTLGDARMEIAVDRLTKELGFEEKIVRKVAKQFLREYDVGDEAWTLIEENNYEALVEGILEYLQSNDLEGSSAAHKDESMMLEDETPNEQALSIPEESPVMQGETSAVATTPAANAEAKAQDDTTEVAGDTDETRLRSPSPVSDKAVVMRSRTRRPCYGWINNDNDSGDDEPQEILELTPRGEIARVFTIPRKRKSSGT